VCTITERGQRKADPVHNSVSQKCETSTRGRWETVLATSTATTGPGPLLPPQSTPYMLYSAQVPGVVLPQRNRCRAWWVLMFACFPCSRAVGARTISPIKKGQRKADPSFQFWPRGGCCGSGRRGRWLHNMRSLDLGQMTTTHRALIIAELKRLAPKK
jgi:hypothetical protein